VRDSARFHFGFTVPFVTHRGAAEVIAAVDASKGDLGIFRLDQAAEAGPWWRMLEGAERPKIIARLPFIDRPDHPAGLPVYVVSKPLAEAAVREVVVASLTVDRWRADAPRRLADLGVDVVRIEGTANDLALLVAHPGALPPAAVAEALQELGCGQSRYVEIGGHTAPFSLQPR
jgi:hypothetical protein